MLDGWPLGGLLQRWMLFLNVMAGQLLRRGSEGLCSALLAGCRFGVREQQVGCGPWVLSAAHPALRLAARFTALRLAWLLEVTAPGPCAGPCGWP